MKQSFKALALFLAITMGAAAFAACGQSDTDVTDNGESAVEITDSAVTEDIKVGAFTPAESPVVTDEVKKLLEKATSELSGAEYTPVAYVASQVVAGTNHLVLCKVTPVVPDAKGHYSLVTIYEDLSGGAEIISTLDCDKEVPPTAEDGSVLSGGYSEPETPELTAEHKEALSKACEDLDGADYEPVAMVAEQVVAGMNYMILCRVTPATENPEPSYSLVTVYADLEGNADITEISGFSAAQE